MTAPTEVTVMGCHYWASNPGQLAQLLRTSRASVIREPNSSGTSEPPITLTQPKAWAEDANALRDALSFASGSAGADPNWQPAGGPAGIAAVQDRLVFTVEEAAQLLGINRAFAYEAVKRGDIPSMRIGRRILVPKAALERFLAEIGDDGPPS